MDADWLAVYLELANGYGAVEPGKVYIYSKYLVCPSSSGMCATGKHIRQRVRHTVTGPSISLPQYGPYSIILFHLYRKAL
jgi:hypothetical protein